MLWKKYLQTYRNMPNILTKKIGGEQTKTSKSYIKTDDMLTQKTS